MELQYPAIRMMTLAQIEERRHQLRSGVVFLVVRVRNMNPLPSAGD